MPAVTFDLVNGSSRNAIEQGATFEWQIWWASPEVAGTDVSDWLVRMQVRRQIADEDAPDEPLASVDSASLGGITLAFAPPAEGSTWEQLSILVTLTDTQTQAMPAGDQWVHDVEVVKPSGQVARVVEGRAQVSGEVTR